MGAAPDRTRLRGEVRPPAGRPLPPRHDLPAVAARQAAIRVPVRSAGDHSALRARAGFRRGTSGWLATKSRHGSSSGSSGSWAGRSDSGTCCRLTRIRVCPSERAPRTDSTSAAAPLRQRAALPSLEPRQRVLLLQRLRDLEHRLRRRAPPPASRARRGASTAARGGSLPACDSAAARGIAFSSAFVTRELRERVE